MSSARIGVSLAIGPHFYKERESSCGYPVAGSNHILRNVSIRYIRNIIKTIVVYSQNPGVKFFVFLCPCQFDNVL